jgi:hypothetical protein
MHSIRFTDTTPSARDSADIWGPRLLAFAGALPVLLPLALVGLWAALYGAL